MLFELFVKALLSKVQNSGLVVKPAVWWSNQRRLEVGKYTIFGVEITTPTMVAKQPTIDHHFLDVGVSLTHTRPSYQLLQRRNYVTTRMISKIIGSTSPRHVWSTAPLHRVSAPL